MYLNFIQHDWRKYYNISKASTWLQNKSNGIAQERKSKFQFLSDLIYVLLFYVCFSFYNFFFISSESRMLCFIATTNKKKEKNFLSFYFPFTTLLLFDIWIYSEMLFLTFRLVQRVVVWFCHIVCIKYYWQSTDKSIIWISLCDIFKKTFQRVPHKFALVCFDLWFIGFWKTIFNFHNLFQNSSLP